MLPSMFWMFCFSMTLFKENWWHHKTDPFFTNCSPYNALICWFLWLIFEMSFWILCFYAIILSIFLIVGIVKGCAALGRNPGEAC